MKFLFDLLPVILFFAVYKWGEGHQDAAHGVVSQYLSGLIAGGAVAAAQAPVILATVVGIIATVLQIGYLLVRGRKVDGMLWMSFGVIAIMGGATIYFHDDNFIKWKPTILYWAFAVILLVAQVFMKKNLMRSAMEKTMKLPEPIWPRLNYAWMWFFFALGLLNLFVAFVVFKGNTSAWVSFKLFGVTGIFFAFVVGQTLLLSKYIEEEA
ncbi:MAG: putative intracellular septation protein [Massilia sp.]|nr:putative intracellular septation protein [Massilia sp.]MDB5952051.1 putative intracellular septation protein [Massilia sp.]